MVLLSNCNLDKNVMFTGLLKYFTFTLLIWTYHTYNDLGKFPKWLENEFRDDKSLNLIFNRLLAKHELETQSKHIVVSGDSLEYKDNKNIKNIKECASIYERIQENNLNNLKNNKKAYIHKNAKKKGIYKLDCYCEEKIFNKIEKINELAKNMNNDRNSIKKVLHKKYGLGFISACLFPFFGIILIALSIKKVDENDWYKESILYGTGLSEQGAISIIAIIMITSYILLLSFIYIIIKYMKYEKIKSGKGKMSIKEYFRCFNDIL